MQARESWAHAVSHIVLYLIYLEFVRNNKSSIRIDHNGHTVGTPAR
jgi:hypothetical protein